MAEPFTIDRYRDIVAAAAARFRFVRFDGNHDSEGICLWRHDIDFSPHRAAVLARIEREVDVTATYFVQVSSRYYSPFEPETAAMLRDIVALGHDIGLHFDTGVIQHRPSPDYERRIAFEASILEELLETRVGCVSMHNPTTLRDVAFDQSSCAGLLNASNPELQGRFVYCSDSNGIWHHRPLDEVVQDTSVRRLYALTHPEWWQDTAMSPRLRIQRSIDGRASYAGRYYDELLALHHRPNVGPASGDYRP